MRKFLEGYDYTTPPHTFGGEDFAGMAVALGIGALKQKYRDVLQGECFRFLVLVASWKQARRRGSIGKHLRKVHSEAAMHLLHISAPDNNWAAIDTDLMKLS